MQRALVVLFAGLQLVGCTDTEPGVTLPQYSRVATTRGSAIVLSRDERVAVATHRSKNLISILGLNPKRGLADLVESRVELDPGPDARPWAAVMGADDDTAYVLLRGSGAVVRVNHLRSHPEIDLRVSVGVEPTSIAITPSGKAIYVANWGDGTISWFSTEHPDEQKEETDLNAALARTGFLGPSLESDAQIWPEAAGFSQRPGLAHPRALAITDDGDGDDDDETLYATEFFAQARPEEETDGNPDQTRQGLVWAINLATGRLLEASPIRINPVATGFQDSLVGPTWCFPNQLYAAAVDRERLLITSMCASPRGPVAGLKGDTRHLKTLLHPAVFSVDVATNQVVPDETSVLTRELETLYDADDQALDAGAPPTERRMPLIPNDIVLDPESVERRAYLTAFGAGALFPISYGDGGTRSFGSRGSRFIKMYDLPVGVALSTDTEPPFALVLSDDESEYVSIIDRDAATFVVGTPALEASESQAELSDERAGRKLFATGLDVWSLDGQAWNSCESCHPEGLSDGVIWQFARGPRRTISTAGTYYRDQPARRLLLWTAALDEVHDVEAIARDIHGGVGGVVWTPYTTGSSSLPSADQRLYYNGPAPCADGAAQCAQPKATSLRHDGLNGALGSLTNDTIGARCDDKSTEPCDVNSTRDWDKLDAFIRSVRAPRAPLVCEGMFDHGCLNPDHVVSGREIFERARCAACHGGPGWTLSRVFYEPGPAANGEVPTHEADETPSEPAVRDAMLGQLRVRTYEVPSEAFRLLNPPAANGSATFRPAPTSEQDLRDFLYGRVSPAPVDQLNCALRDVGTFNGDIGVIPEGEGAMPFDELRQRVDPASNTYLEPELALGATGYNIPSLVGLATAAWYYHAGNARTLEEVFHEAFTDHHANAAIMPEFEPSPAEVRDLVSYLLSIDEREELSVDQSSEHRWLEPPTWQEGDVTIDPDLCAQFER